MKDISMVVSTQTSTRCVADGMIGRVCYTFTFEYNASANTGYLGDNEDLFRSGTVYLRGAFSRAVAGLSSGDTFSLSWSNAPTMTGIGIAVP